MAAPVMTQVFGQDYDIETGEARIEAAALQAAFILGGNATFTLRSPSGVRYTYRVRIARDRWTKEVSEDGPWFVSVLHGPSNETDYRFIGTIFDRETFRPGRGVDRAHGSVRGFAWAFGRIVAAKDLKGIELWHAGKCGRCGRKLTVPESIRAGIGPECAKKGG